MTMTGSNELEIKPEIVTEDHCVVGIGNVLAVVSKAAPNGAYLARMMQVHREYKQHFPQGQALIIVVTPKAGPPDDETKGRLKMMMQSLAGTMIAGCHVVDGEGFRSAAMRAALTLINLMAKFPFPMRVFADLEPASEWIVTTMAERVVPGMNPKALATLIREAQQRYDQGRLPLT